MTTQAIPPTATTTPFLASSHQDSKKHLLLATTGSVATIKLPLLLTRLSEAFSPTTLTIHLLLSPASKNFLSPTDLQECASNPLISRIWSDADEWAFPTGTYTRGCPVLHIELRKWADLLVVAPMSANTLSSVVVGRCDGLLLSVLRAWDWEGKGVVVAPAMNTLMWTHPVTSGQVKTLKRWGVEVLMPVRKVLACGDDGVGGMVGVEVVVEAVGRTLGILPAEEEEEVVGVVEG
ncbi:flavo protein [Choiromyces venosus 120613-1]|uniref:Flavo protein n=1 Tax=Choiromyces venosus 120613-1 TaxID=1336337 RepID=A0A3N4JS42_9PEZI|nr:flavo protein [Choiromyces venosus 120613-1]